MCGRFTQHYTWTEVHTFLDLFGAPRNLRPRYNIAPTTVVVGRHPLGRVRHHDRAGEHLVAGRRVAPLVPEAGQRQHRRAIRS